VRATSELNGMAGRVQNANPAGLTELLAEADRQGSALDERLRPIIQQADKPDADAATKLAAVPARLAVVIRDESQLPPLQEAMLTGELTYVAPIRTRLRRYAAKLRPQWFELLRNPAESAARRFRAALGLVGLDGDQLTAEWTDADIRFVATELSTSVAEYQPQLRELLRPISGQLVPVLDELFDAETSTTDQQISVALALADFAKDDKELLARMLTRATARQTEILYPLVAETKTGTVRDGLLALTREQPDENLGQLARVRLGRRRANAAITLLRQGERDAYFDTLRITDDPESLSQFVHRCRSWGVTPQELLESFDRCAELRKTATGAAKRLESRVLYGLLIALGSYPLDQIPEASREAVFTKLLALYESDPSAAVHSASGWLLRMWGREADVAKLDEVEVPYDASGERDWFRLRVGVAAKSNGPLSGLGLFGPLQYHSLTFVVVPAGEYRLGSPDFEGGEVDRNKDETPRVVKLTRPFAMCDREVTWGLYQAFDGGDWREAMVSQWGWELTDADVVFGRNYFDWIDFCRWLTSEYRGDDESWQCYRDPEQLEKDGNGNPRVGRLLVERGGFRMPTESEWEVGARAGQRTAYTFGSDVNLLSTHGWFVDNSTGKRPQVSAAKPPGLGGLHDVQGNLFEWVHDRYGEIDGGSVIVDPQGPLSDGQTRVLRGGCWNLGAALCRSAFRSSNDPAFRSTHDGFRLALSPSVNKPPEADEKEQQTQESN
jgi:formylglycine-generating enzyme required for sulfatase activity